MATFEDLTGKKIGYLKVLYRADDWIQPSGQHKRMWHCLCECGKECNVRASDLKTGNTTSCGCKSSRRKSVGLENLTGKQFGDFLVINRAPNRITPSGQQTRVWHCKCIKCGLEKDIQASQLKSFSGKCSCSKKITEDINLKEKTVNSKEKAHKKKKTEKYVKSNKKQKVLVKKVTNRTEDSRIQNSLAKSNPILASEWDVERNGDVTPFDIAANSGKLVWWLGKCGHNWNARVYSRNKGSGCPYCSNQRLLSGFNDIKTRYPEIVLEWDYENNDKSPEEVCSLNSDIYWKCKRGHSYKMKVALRVGKQKCGCPYCSVPAKKVLKGFNDLATTNPSVLVEWDYNKNEVKPDEVLAGSARKIWWVCKEGHSYRQSIVYKVKSKNKSTCPYCSHQKLLKGYNDLATTHPYILTEWDYEKNTVLPTQIGVGTHNKIWWKCPFGHSYQTYPSNRCGRMHTGCPICKKENHTSFPEQAVLYYVKQYFSDAINSDKEQIGMELDIYIPRIKTAIEYDGKTWHNNNSFELKKNENCKNNGVRLIRIREADLKLYDDCICLVRDNVRNNDSLSLVIRDLLSILDVQNADVDVERDASSIYSSYIETRKAKSLASVYPEIAKEWHLSKNGQLTPEMVAPISNKVVWWLGECGHEYQMEISNRTNQNCGCPYCSGKRVLQGFNDFETWCKENDIGLLTEWCYERNKVLPSEVTKSSDKIVYWKCKKCNNIWKTKIDSRTRMKSGCPKCANYYRNAKAVINVDTGIIYGSMIEAEKKLNINRACIGNVCRGKQKTAGGYRWSFYTEK